MVCYNKKCYFYYSKVYFWWIIYPFSVFFSYIGQKNVMPLEQKYTKILDCSFLWEGVLLSGWLVTDFFYAFIPVYLQTVI